MLSRDRCWSSFPDNELQPGSLLFTVFHSHLKPPQTTWYEPDNGPIRLTYGNMSFMDDDLAFYPMLCDAAEDNRSGLRDVYKDKYIKMGLSIVCPFFELLRQLWAQIWLWHIMSSMILINPSTVCWPRSENWQDCFSLFSLWRIYPSPSGLPHPSLFNSMTTWLLELCLLFLFAYLFKIVSV